MNGNMCILVGVCVEESTDLCFITKDLLRVV